MSKRYIFPQQSSERKKARLDITVSDHNFPLSQNPHSNKEAKQSDTWGDDNDDEILLMASQACEQAYNNSALLDYSMCMKPTSTSTQLYDQPSPSTSKGKFTFKKPTSTPVNAVTTNLKDKCNLISSPLPGITSKTVTKTNNHINERDDVIFNDKIYKGQDSDYVYRQLLQLQEENTKLKSENGKLLEKCVTKEGEASILRTQLKTCQVAVDNARMEKVKAQEKVQIEWTEKVSAANNQMHDLRTQLDFKNLEIISIKERCKLLESSKIKLTQVTIPNNDISSSYRNSSFQANFPNTNQKKVKVSSNSVQTEMRAPFVKINKSLRTEPSKLQEILPLILKPTEHQYNLLDHNEKLHKRSDFDNKCRVFSSFHRVPSTPVSRFHTKDTVSLSEIHKDIVYIASANHKDVQDRYVDVLNITKKILEGVKSDLEVISQRYTTAFQREMDEKYIESTSMFLTIEPTDLLQGRSLYKEEQAILARRVIALWAHIIGAAEELNLNFEDKEHSNLMRLLSTICHLIDTNSCAVPYSGLLMSVTLLLDNIYTQHTRNVDIIKSIVTGRPTAAVCCRVLQLLGRVPLQPAAGLCPGTSVGNLKTDYDQGVLLYKKETCHLQILLKQIETSLKCVEVQSLRRQAAATARALLALHVRGGTRCECRVILLQVIVYSLRICALLIDDSDERSELESVCRSGIQVLGQWSARDGSLAALRAHGEGHLAQFCELAHLAGIRGSMLTELSSTFQAVVEDAPPCYHKQAWLDSFDSLSMAD